MTWASQPFLSEPMSDAYEARLVDPAIMAAMFPWWRERRWRPKVKPYHGASLATLERRAEYGGRKGRSAERWIRGIRG